MKSFNCPKLLLYFLVITQNVGPGWSAPRHQHHLEEPSESEAIPEHRHIKKKYATGMTPEVEGAPAQDDDDYDAPEMTSRQHAAQPANDEDNEGSETGMQEETGDNAEPEERTSNDPAETKPQNTEGAYGPPQTNIVIMIPNGNSVFQKQSWGSTGPIIYTNVGALGDGSDQTDPNQNNVVILIPPPRSA